MMFSRLWIDEHGCAVFIEAIGQYRREWHHNLGRFGDNPVHDPISSLTPISPPSVK